MEQNSFAQEYGHSIFNFGFGFFLIEVATLPNWAGWLVSVFTVALGLWSITLFASYAHFWKLALNNADHFKPGGELHESGKTMFNRTVNSVHSYRHKEAFWTSVGCSLLFMAGLIQHQLWVAFGVEAIASVIGYAVIRSFLTHFPMYYKLIEGKELENV